MPEVLLSNDDITVLGPPSNIDVQLDIGPTGQRGSQIFVGAGDPNPLTSNGKIFTKDIYENDLYINNATGSSYSYMYQYVSKYSGPTWQPILKVNPAIYSLIETVSFNNGEGSLDILISNIVQNSGTPLNESNFNVQFAVQEADDFVTCVITSTEITGTSNEDLTINLKAIKYNGSSWSNVTDDITIHFFISVVI